MGSNTGWKIIVKELEPILGNTAYFAEHQKKQSIQKKRNKILMRTGLLVGTGVLALGLWFMGARWVYRKFTKADEKDRMTALYESCGCNSVDDCLSKDSIKSARKILLASDPNTYEKEKELVKIIRKEGAILRQNEKFEEGWTQINTEHFDMLKYELEATKYEYLTQIVDIYLEKGDRKSASKWAKRGSTELDQNGFPVTNTKKTQQKLLLKRIAEY